MKSLAYSLATMTALLLVACHPLQLNETVPPTQQPKIGEPQQSQCLDTTIVTTGVELIANASTLTIVDPDVEFNCCLDAWMEVSIDGNDIVVVEVEDPDKSASCRCVCPFELSITISNLATGSYNVKVFQHDQSAENLRLEASVKVGGTVEPIIRNNQQSECLRNNDDVQPDHELCEPMDAGLEDFNCDTAWGYAWNGDACEYLGGACLCNGVDCDNLYSSAADCEAIHADCNATTPPPTVEIEVRDGVMYIVDHAMTGTCCMEYVMQVEMQGQRIVVVEEEQPGEPCSCICQYEVSVEIASLASGSYEVEVYAFAEVPSNLLHSATVLVP